MKNKQVTSNEIILNNHQDNTVDIEKTIEFEEIKDTLNKIIESFTEVMKSCIKLYYYDDYSVKEVSQKLNIKENLVKYYLYEARKKIRRELNDNN